LIGCLRPTSVPPRIARYIRKTFSAHTCKNVIVDDVREGVYTWTVEREPDAPVATRFDIKLVSSSFMTELEDGKEQAVGEWLSRKIGHVVPLFEQSDIDRANITHPREPVELWTAAPVVQPMVRETEHVLVFHVAEKKFTSKQIRCAFRYDLDELMTLGSTQSEHMPGQPALVKFPDRV
jgi:hypothetical protein